MELQLKNLDKDIKTEKGENWLIAKKPLDGHYCGSCESYLGKSLNDSTSDKFIHWNKYPIKDKATIDNKGEKIYRVNISINLYIS